MTNRLKVICQIICWMLLFLPLSSAHAYNFNTCEAVPTNDFIIDDLSGRRLASLIDFYMNAADLSQDAAAQFPDVNCSASTEATFLINAKQFTLGYPGAANNKSDGVGVSAEKIEVAIADPIDGNSSLQRNVTLYSRIYNGKLCVQALLPTGLITLGCKNTAVPSFLNNFSTSCYIHTSCTKQSSNSKMPMPMTSLIVECFMGTVDNIFSNPAGCGNKTVLGKFQDSLRPAVMAALVLYAVIFAAGIMLSPEQFQKSSLFNFGIKMVLVLYFSTGFVTQAPGLVRGHTVTTYTHGITFLYHASVTTSLWLGDLLLNTGQQNGLCKFEPSEYADGYQNLAMWDALDCRLA